jgi:hypothetical protein
MQFDRNGNPIWAEGTTPGRHLNGLTNFFYQVGSEFVFSGYGGLNAAIALGYYAFPPSLKYYSEANRPCILRRRGRGGPTMMLSSPTRIRKLRDS